MSEEPRGAVDGDEPDEQPRDSEDGKSIRDSAFEGDSSSEYIQGAILKASESERKAADEMKAKEPSRFQIWLSEVIAGNDSRIGDILYNANPRNYDRLDWIFAFSFVVIVAGMAVMFQTSSLQVAIASFIVMFLAFVSMLLCVGIEDILKDGFHSIGGDEETK